MEPLALVRLVLEQMAAGTDPDTLIASLTALVEHERSETPHGLDEPASAADLDAIRDSIVDQGRDHARLENDAARFEKLADTLSDAVWDWDLSTGRVWRNAALTTVFGYPRETLAPTVQPWIDAIHEDDRDEVVGSLQAAIDGDAADWTRDYRIRRHDGSVAHVSDRNRILRAPDGIAIRVMGGITDVSDRRIAEEALLNNETRFRELAEQATEGIFLQVLHPDRRFEYLNPAVEAMLGLPREAVYADASLVIDAIPEQDRERMWAELERAQAITDPIDVDLRHRDGNVRRVRIRGVPLRDEQGRIINVQASVTDVTREHREQLALREALEQQRQLSDLQTGFIQAVSHELRTPLTSIQGFVELLLERELSPDDQRRYLTRIARGAERLKRLVNDVLDLDRFDHPGAALDQETVDLGELVRRAIDEIGAATHPIHLDVPTVTVVADGVLLERVVDNLIRNALKHTPDGTPIWVRTRAPGTIVVEDAGPGVVAELREQLFEPFRQGADQRDHPTPGLGIGLALTRRIVRLHGGEVALDERPGGGSRFTITLPVEPNG